MVVFYFLTICYSPFTINRILITHESHLKIQRKKIKIYSALFDYANILNTLSIGFIGFFSKTCMLSMAFKHNHKSLLKNH